ncbi:MerR family transcriptional regulator [Sinomonas sp. JGH33]|uniref:MerR family transcriptional regulator n=1 Tax=Sinomonas terricola TaxID=3110330 RepID=A0ABU5T145_9MICC|nr:MerR family transcriptional regulator [Sinomonas sp. JGH33]MEA5453369.1 MerR family transcriptional regulator [Sinomonas sp. JGH33]
MQLRELSSLTGVPIASIKFYLREGLLPPGRRLTATRSDYDEAHARRIATIQTLRGVNDLSIAQIRAIVALIDTGASRVEIMKSLQREVQSLGEPVPGRTQAGNAVVALRGWPDVPTAARGALDAHLEQMARLGVSVPPAALDVYSRAVDLIAHVDVEDAAAAEDLDTLVARVAVGMHMHRELVLKLLALAQTSRSIALYGRAPGPNGSLPPGPDIPKSQVTA